MTADQIEAKRRLRPRLRNQFGYFGQLNPYKGADTLLRAIDLLGSDFDGYLWVYGANLQQQLPEWQRRFGELMNRPRPNVTFAGGYQRSELAELMARSTGRSCRRRGGRPARSSSGKPSSIGDR